MKVRIQHGLLFLAMAFILVSCDKEDTDDENLEELETVQSEMQSGDGVTDIDGNYYPSVIIGNQEWLAKDLRVTKYNNGEAILTGFDIPDDWSKNTEGAYTLVGASIDETGVFASYGLLYNWYAVNDARGICPAGWRVATESDWDELDAFVYPDDQDGQRYGGNELKACRQLGSPLAGDCNTNEHPRWDADEVHYGNDKYGFAALPAAWRFADGWYYDMPGSYAAWWTSDASTEPENAIGRMLYHYSNTLTSYDGLKNTGMGVRCIKMAQ